MINTTKYGAGALQNNSGSNNTGIGAYNLNKNTTGTKNTSTGSNAQYFNTTGSNNTSMGSGALCNNSTGSLNTAIGSSALEGQSQGQPVGDANTAVGVQALYTVKGNNNTAIGAYAGLNGVTTSNNNTFLGALTGFADDTEDYSNSTAVGYGAQITDNNQIMLGGYNATASTYPSVIIPGTAYLTNFSASTSEETQIVPKSYVDTISSGITLKPPCVCINTSNVITNPSNINVLTTYSPNEPSLIIDGYLIQLGDAVLFNNQGQFLTGGNTSTPAVNNGIYIFSLISTSPNTYGFIRSSYMAVGSTSTNITTYVKKGDTYGHSLWRESNEGVVGTDALIFILYNQLQFELGVGLNTVDIGGKPYLNVDSSMAYVNEIDSNSLATYPGNQTPASGTLNIGSNTTTAVNIGNANIPLTINSKVGILTTNPLSSTNTLDVSGTCLISTNSGSSVTASLTMNDAVSNYNVNVYPNLPKQNYNPIVPASTTGIISKNSPNFTISKFQGTNCGIVMGETSLLLGCGGTSTTPAQSVTLDGSNGTITLTSENGVNMGGKNVSNANIVSASSFQSTQYCKFQYSSTQNLGIEVAAASSEAYMDFHSSQISGGSNVDGRILCTGGSSSEQFKGNMYYYGAQHNFNNSPLINISDISVNTISNTGNITIYPTNTLTVKGVLDMCGNNIINVPTINNSTGDITIYPTDTLIIKGVLDMCGNNIINVPTITSTLLISAPEINATTINASNINVPTINNTAGNITIDPNNTLTIKGVLDMCGNNITNINTLSGNITINPTSEVVLKGYLQTSNACYLSKSNTANYQITLATGTSASYIDFHSSGATSNGKTDGRILCSGGSTTANYQGQMLYYGSAHNFNNAPLITIPSISNTGNITIDPSNTLTIKGTLDMCGNEIINANLIETTNLSTSSITTSAITSSGPISITSGAGNSVDLMSTLDLKSNDINNVGSLSASSVSTTSLSASLIVSDGNMSITPGDGNEVIINGLLSAQVTTTSSINTTDGDLTITPATNASVIISGDLNMESNDINGVNELTATTITSSTLSTTTLSTTSIDGPESENIIVNKTLDMNGNSIINLGNIELDFSNINISDISVNTISSTGNITVDPSNTLIINGTLDMSMNSINNVVAIVGTGTKNITINPNGHQLVIQNSLGADLNFGGNKITNLSTINLTSNNELLINGALNLKTNLLMSNQSSNIAMIQCLNNTLNLNIGSSGGLGGVLSVAGYISSVNTISTEQHLTAGQNISANGNLQIVGNSSLCYSSTTNKQLFVSSNSTNGTYIDFHSSALSGVTVPDGRISCTGGTTTNYGGILNYYGTAHNFNNAPLTNLTTLSGTGNITIDPSNTLTINGTLDMGNNSIINIGSIQTNYTDISVNEITSTGNITIDPSNTLTINGTTVINTTFPISSSPSLRVVNVNDSTSHFLDIVPNTAPGNWNPIAQSGDTSIVSSGNSPLVLTTNQSTNAGMRISTDKVMLGAGGGLSTPTTNITIDGSNNIITINGDVSLNGTMTISGQSSNWDTTNNNGYSPLGYYTMPDGFTYQYGYCIASQSNTIVSFPKPFTQFYGIQFTQLGGTSYNGTTAIPPLCYGASATDGNEYSSATTYPAGLIYLYNGTTMVYGTGQVTGFEPRCPLNANDQSAFYWFAYGRC